jgi:nucleotide-binding universal stress UspA family protein
LITKILVGVDGSENSEKTLDCALEIATELKEGYAPSQIVETAAKGQFGLIVLGHRGDSQIKNSFVEAQAKESPTKQHALC